MTSTPATPVRSASGEALCCIERCRRRNSGAPRLKELDRLSVWLGLGYPTRSDQTSSISELDPGGRADRHLRGVCWSWLRHAEEETHRSRRHADARQPD